MNKSLFKIVIIGNSSAGKTSILHRFAKGTFQNFKSTIGTDILIKKMCVENRDVTLQMWDTSGSERYKAINALYYRGADACILVFDLTDTESFNDLEYWKNDFLSNNNPSRCDKFPFVLIGNKVDLVDDRKITETMAELFCLKHCIPYIECSAKDDLNIELAFQTLVERIFEYENQIEIELPLESPMTTLNLNLTNLNRNEPTNSCC